MYSHLPPLLFPLVFLDTLLLLSSCRREGVHQELPGVRGLLGVRLPVDVPVAPFGEFRIFVYHFRIYVSDLMSLL